jgi:hypothetical protein
VGTGDAAESGTDVLKFKIAASAKDGDLRGLSQMLSSISVYQKSAESSIFPLLFIGKNRDFRIWLAEQVRRKLH